MSTTWMLHRFRNAFFHENLLLIILALLKEKDMSEWEILSLMSSRFRSTPSAKEFRKAVASLVGGRYADLETTEGVRRLRITDSGRKLLKSLDDEYRAIVSRMEGRRRGEPKPA